MTAGRGGLGTLAGGGGRQKILKSTLYSDFYVVNAIRTRVPSTDFVACVRGKEAVC